jgi:hypothetical protein
MIFLLKEGSISYYEFENDRKDQCLFPLGGSCIYASGIDHLFV